MPRTDADGSDEAGLKAAFAELHDQACLADRRVPNGEDLEKHGGLLRAAIIHLVHRAPSKKKGERDLDTVNLSSF